MSTAATLSACQAGRAAALPAQPDAPMRMAMLEGVRQRNTALDAFFYDIGVVTPAEAAAISPWLAAEGALLIVPPSGAGALTLCPTLDDFLEAGGGDVRALAIAGVGSSALGSAAFARNVADAMEQPVAAVVSGYGLADVMAEAMGGFFWFGALNSIRHAFEGLDRWAEGFSAAEHALEGDVVTRMRESRDMRTVMAMLSDGRCQFDLLTGHSKGNLVLSEALYALRDDAPACFANIVETSRIVTISARIAMPPPLEGVIDVMGELDWFGSLNSRPFIPPDVIVPGAWHHTNTELAAHLPVTGTLRGLL